MALRWRIALVLLLLAIAGWFVFGREKAIEVRTAPTAAIGAGTASASVLDASGYVVARRMATVSAKITGKVREVMIEEGQRVEAGQVHGHARPDRRRRRTLAMPRRSWAPRKARSTGAQAQLVEAEANARRLSTLVNQQLVSQVAVRPGRRRSAIRCARSWSPPSATPRSSADRLRIADNGVDNTVVRAPFAGVITAKAAQPGEIVSPLSAGGGFTRTGIGTIVDMDSLEVEVEVGEAFIGRVQPKMPVEATLNAYPDWKIPGEVIAIIPTADRGKATVKVRVALNVKDPRIVPDMGVQRQLPGSGQARRAQPKTRRAPAPPSATATARTCFRGDRRRTVEQRELRLGREWATTARCCKACRPANPCLDPPAN